MIKFAKRAEEGFSHVVALVGVVVLVGAVGTYMLVNSHAATPCVKQILGQGNNGPCVSDVQTMLNSMVAHKSTAGWTGNGYAGGVKIAVDGNYGPATKGQVIINQKWFNTTYIHHVSVDGVVGSDTWRVLCDNTYYQGFSDAHAAGKNAGCDLVSNYLWNS